MNDTFLIGSRIKDFIIPNTYSDSGVNIEIIPNSSSPNWYKAGYLNILLPFGSKWVPIGNKSILLTWNQVIEVPYQSYRLSFSPEFWLNGCQFIINSYQIKYNLMSGSFQSVNPTVVNDTPLVIGAVTANIVAVPANPLRSPECLIVNNSNKNMWVTFTGAAATLTPPSIKVIAGGNYDVPGSYVGAINAIWEPGASGSAVFYGFTYQ